MLQLIKLGENPSLRIKNGKPIITDNFCFIIDVTGLKIINPVSLKKSNSRCSYSWFICY
ncbi:split ribose-5-phosphate isomerase A [Candidatus Profftella armatura]|uniref:Split ribose-5-phosphate isomerase A n=1 Tax=Candidatus Profftella armatura TaxID=669502 RepID=S5RM04_9PROT|nr:split ribose-5-phosphate isomerase A [Candidatus Profftella armatura]AGS06971.1 split ribose-5-phosphate isomerase A [Candidatus Profftella armatura]